MWYGQFDDNLPLMSGMKIGRSRKGIYQDMTLDQIEEHIIDRLTQKFGTAPTEVHIRDALVGYAAGQIAKGHILSGEVFIDRKRLMPYVTERQKLSDFLQEAYRIGDEAQTRNSRSLCLD